MGMSNEEKIERAELKNKLLKKFICRHSSLSLAEIELRAHGFSTWDIEKFMRDRVIRFDEYKDITFIRHKRKK